MMNEMRPNHEVQDLLPGFYYQAGGAHVTKRSPLSGELNTVWIPHLEPESVDSWLNGEYIQDALFYLDKSQREFVKTGITSEEWSAVFGA